MSLADARSILCVETGEICSLTSNDDDFQPAMEPRLAHRRQSRVPAELGGRGKGVQNAAHQGGGTNSRLLDNATNIPRGTKRGSEKTRKTVPSFYIDIDWLLETDVAACGTCSSRYRFLVMRSCCAWTATHSWITVLVCLRTRVGGWMQLCMRRILARTGQSKCITRIMHHIGISCVCMQN